MRFVILVTVLGLAAAAPSRSYSTKSGPREVVPILRDVRQQEDDGRYNVDVKTGNGIVLTQSGSPSSASGAVVNAGQYSYIAPDGTNVQVRFVADENGCQPQSDLLPVAPDFPHPIPDFVLEQIRRAEEEDKNRSPGSYSYQ